MAPRAYWKGFLRLSLVSCPIALYPATSEREKIHFHQLNRKTGNRIQYKKVDAETGRELYSSNKLISSFTHFNEPVVVGGQVYVCTWDGKVYAFGLKK